MSVTYQFKFVFKKPRKGIKLTHDQVMTIKAMAQDYTEIELGKMFRVNPSMINHIKTGRCWSSLFQ